LTRDVTCCACVRACVQYQWSLAWGLLIAAAWCVVVACSRVYLGLHSPVDVAAGGCGVVGLKVCGGMQCSLRCGAMRCGV
jgi:membrane-associated phospholipid phosphatase